MESLKRAAAGLKSKLTKNKVEQALSDATKDDNQWTIPIAVTNTITEASYNTQDSKMIMKFVWEKLKSKPNKWKVIQKTLILIENLLKLGATRLLYDVRDETFKIRLLTDFEYREGHEDKGQYIREKSRQILDLLNSQEMLDEERNKAREYASRFGQPTNSMHGQTHQRFETVGFGPEDYYYNKPEQSQSSYDPWVPRRNRTPTPPRRDRTERAPTPPELQQGRHTDRNVQEGFAPPKQVMVPPARPSLPATFTIAKPKPATVQVQKPAVPAVDIFSAPVVEPINRITPPSAPTVEPINRVTPPVANQNTVKSQPNDIFASFPSTQALQPSQAANIFDSIRVEPANAPPAPTNPDIIDFAPVQLQASSPPVTTPTPSQPMPVQQTPTPVVNQNQPMMAPQAPNPALNQMSYGQPQMMPNTQQNFMYQQPQFVQQPMYGNGYQQMGYGQMPQQTMMMPQYYMQQPGYQMPQTMPQTMQQPQQFKISHNMSSQAQCVPPAQRNQPNAIPQSSASDLESRIQNFDNLIL